MTKVEALRHAQLQLIRGEARSDLLARRGIGGVGKLGEVAATKPSSDANRNSPLVSVSTSHPYFWAPFILVGDGKYMQRSVSGITNLVFTAGLGSSIVGLTVCFKSR